MTIINLQQKNYKLNREEYQLVLPIDYEVIIPEDDSVRLLSRIHRRDGFVSIIPSNRKGLSGIEAGSPIYPIFDKGNPKCKNGDPAFMPWI